jgi:DNA invertase Pin-like site-specific DNA recombinase
MKRLVGYIRQSLQDAASSSPERQLEIIEAWAKAHGYIVTKIYRDIGGKRSESDNVKTRKDFQKLLKDANAHKFDIIVIASQERLGTSDFYKFVGYLSRFNQLGIELWDAGKNALLNPHGTEAAGILQSTIGTILDTGEQMTRSRNTVTGQTTKARKGQYLGGNIAYGVAIQCVDQNGAIIWTSEMVGKKLYETLYTDGRVSVKPYTPCGDRAPSDRLLFCRSRYPDRIKVIKIIYESFLAGAGASKIAGTLNSMGYRLPGGRLFYNSYVHKIISDGHVYNGRVAFFKTNVGKFYQGNKNSPVPVKNLKGKTKFWFRTFFLRRSLDTT